MPLMSNFLFPTFVLAVKDSEFQLIQCQCSVSIVSDPQDSGLCVFLEVFLTQNFLDRVCIGGCFEVIAKVVICE